MKKVLIFLLFFSIIFLVFGEKIAEFDEIFKLRSFKIDGNHLYVVDGYEIKVFSLKDGKLLTKFGKHGEGPGEFPRHPRIQVLPNQVFVSVMGKISYFKKDGKYISENKVPPFNIYFKVKQNLLLEESITNENMSIEKVYVKVLDSEFNKIKDLYMEEKKLLSFSRSGEIKTKKDLHLYSKKKISLSDGDHIIVFDNNKGFYIDIYDHNGLRLNTIDIDMEKIPVSDQAREKTMKRFRENKYWDMMKKRNNFIFPKHFPDIQWITGENEKLYVSTYKRIDDKKEIVILNLKGDILKKTYVSKMNHYLFHNNKYYYFIDNEEDEVWELHSVNL